MTLEDKVRALEAELRRVEDDLVEQMTRRAKAEALVLSVQVELLGGGSLARLRAITGIPDPEELYPTGV